MQPAACYTLMDKAVVSAMYVHTRPRLCSAKYKGCWSQSRFPPPLPAGARHRRALLTQNTNIISLDADASMPETCESILTTRYQPCTLSHHAVGKKCYCNGQGGRAILLNGL